MHTPYTLLLTKFFLSLFFISCTQQADTLQTYEQEKMMMGTVMKIKAAAEGDEEKTATIPTTLFTKTHTTTTSSISTPAILNMACKA